MKEYTPIRRFYAWVGFLSLIAYVLIGISYLIPSVVRYERPAQEYIIEVATITAYTSSPDETDDTPFENAAGTMPRPGSIACPTRYPFGTVVSIEGKLYRCDDRMAAKFRNESHFDIWMESKADAFEFGRQSLTVVIMNI